MNIKSWLTATKSLSAADAETLISENLLTVLLFHGRAIFHTFYINLRVFHYVGLHLYTLCNYKVLNVGRIYSIACNGFTTVCLFVCLFVCTLLHHSRCMWNTTFHPKILALHSSIRLHIFNRITLLPCPACSSPRPCSIASLRSSSLRSKTSSNYFLISYIRWRNKDDQAGSPCVYMGQHQRRPDELR